jgi:hypothetical protein
MQFYKDEVLNRLAPTVNIAQFVSFGPDLTQRFSWIRGRSPNERMNTVEDACAALLQAAASQHLNIRSFKPDNPKGHELIRNIASSGEALSLLQAKASHGFYTIANELIPLDDGGVSGVSVGGVMEFAPGDTPKCVDRPEVTSLPREQAARLLELVYGFKPEIGDTAEKRVEFSIHPLRRGYRQDHVITWEIEPASPVRRVQIGRWPNRFSKFIGDKAYGLLIAHLLGFPVPTTTVFGRYIAPFVFGENTGSFEHWLRTCPRVPVAGKYPTTLGWEDPYLLMQRCDPKAEVLASILSQQSVKYLWSGAARTTDHGVQVEGIPGRGDPFMVAASLRQAVPAVVHKGVLDAHDALSTALRSVKFEWVWDGQRVWIVQLHRRPKGLSEDIIFPGEVSEKVYFDPRQFGRDEVLDELRALIARIRGKDVMVVVTGDVGVTSHLGDILAEAEVPSRLRWVEDAADDAPTQLPLEYA